VQQRMDQWFYVSYEWRLCTTCKPSFVLILSSPSQVQLVAEHVDHSEDDIPESCEPDESVVSSEVQSSR
jgi:hypothetical protein